MSVYDNLAFGLKTRKLPRAEIEHRVRETSEALGLADCLHRKPGDLSGGQRQRVAVGRALARRPKVLLFDEPLSNLDTHLRLQMRAEIVRLRRRLAATIIYVTHDQVEAMTLGDRIAVMKCGAIQQVAPPLQLYREPANLFVAGFIGSPPMNFLNGTIVAKSNQLCFQEQIGTAPNQPRPIILGLDEAMAPTLQSRAGTAITLGIRPEDLCCQPDGKTDSPETTVELLVDAVQPMGFETHVHLAGGSHPLVARVSPSTALDANQMAKFAFRMQNAHFFDPKTGKAMIP
jgi:multiple sugar transport system ATP-binding protein